VPAQKRPNKDNNKNMIPISINNIIEATGGRLIRGAPETIVSGISIDSRTIKKDETFIAIYGDNFNGHDFVPEVIKKGAKGIIVEKLDAS
jgi:UDP-N-acetylmuramoyl-tripeptide--D-alanyl-D-alanine ligase